MGIPKFYRWLSERYPLINQNLAPADGGTTRSTESRPSREQGGEESFSYQGSLTRLHRRQAPCPAIDNLYLDFNGVVHNATHGPGSRLRQRRKVGPAEELAVMFQDIDRYLDTIVTLVRPLSLIYIAIDGVAPRAKMNQQRSRRFRSAKEARDAKESAQLRGEPEEAEDTGSTFDSNCITPGTEFMEKLNEHMVAYIQEKVRTDPLWQTPDVIFSGPQTPGEGEHKIMEYIRQGREDGSHSWKPNQRHCIYGLDADLILLALSTHEPHFVILREIVRFGGNSRGGNSARQSTDAINMVVSPEEGFMMLHIGLLREYIELEMRIAEKDKAHSKGDLDVERCIDDLVVLCTLIGNDFVPHLPALDIADGSLGMLLQTYREKVLAKGTHLSYQNDINLVALLPILKEMAALEKERFLDNSDEDCGFEAIKSRYYQSKFDFDPQASPEDVRPICKAYLEALAWVSAYYTSGVPSWGWFYPYHYAPLISDVLVFVEDFSNFDDVTEDTSGSWWKPKFELGQPFDPILQLMAVLPPLSSSLVPLPLRHIMLDDASPMAYWYPKEFDIDMDGKRNEWEGVVLVPFIDEEILIESTLEILATLPMEFIGRNKKEHAVLISARNGIVPIKMKPIEIPQRPFTARLTPGTETGIRCPVGYPTFRSLSLSMDLKPAKVNVFGMPSRKESLILQIVLGSEVAIPTIENIANQVLGKEAYIDWPFLCPATVDIIENKFASYWARSKTNSAGKPRIEERKGADAEKWLKNATMLVDTFLSLRGIECQPLPESPIIAHVSPISGVARDYDGTVKKNHTRQRVQVPLQLALRCHPQQTQTAADTSAKKVDNLEAIKPGSKAVLLMSRNYGNICTVSDVLGPQSVRVQVNSQAEAIGVQAIKKVTEGIFDSFCTARDICKRLSISEYQLARVSASLMIKVDGDLVDLGLNLKSNSKQLYTPGLVKHVNNASGRGAQWQFSEKAVDLLQKYRTSFPWVFMIAKMEMKNKDIPSLESLFPDVDYLTSLERLFSAKRWLQGQISMERPWVPCEHAVLDDSTIEAIERVLNSHIPKSAEILSQLDVPRQRLLTYEDVFIGGHVIDSLNHQVQIGDIVIICSVFPSPLLFGRKGVVTGFYEKDVIEVILDQPIAEGDVTSGAGVDLGGRCSKGRGTIQRTNRVLRLMSLRKTGPPSEYPDKANGSTKLNDPKGMTSMDLKSTNKTQAAAPDNSRFTEYWKALEELAVSSSP